MSLMLRRTHADDPAREVELPQTIEIEALHTLLHRRGEADLAAALLLRLTPEGAGDLAALLARFRRRSSRPSLFRSYTRLLDAEGARQVDLAVAFLNGARHAGCRVYPDLHTADDETPATPERPRPLYPLPADSTEEDAHTAGGDPGDHLSPRIMPPWLPRPHSSAWDR